MSAQNWKRSKRRLRWGCTAQLNMVEVVGTGVVVWVVGVEAERLPQLVAAEAVLLLLQRAHHHHPPRLWLKVEQRRKTQSTIVPSAWRTQTTSTWQG